MEYRSVLGRRSPASGSLTNGNQYDLKRCGLAYIGGGQLRPHEWPRPFVVGRVRKHATLEARRHPLTMRNSAL
jgi:hypothetical protein